MKGVVLDIKDGYAAVMTDCGQFLKIEDCNYQIGTELFLEEETNVPSRTTRIPFRKQIYKIAASAAAVVVLTLGIKDFYTPYSTISVDVNPSIEMSVNRYDLVLGITAVNDDADELVSELIEEGMRYKSVDNAVETVLTHIENGTYQAEDGSIYVMMSANSANENHSEKLAEQFVTIGNSHPDIVAEAVSADDELLERAKDAGTTAGKLYLVDRLRNELNSEDFSEEEWLEKPIKDIVHECNQSESEITAEPEENSPASAPGEDTDFSSLGTDDTLPPDREQLNTIPGNNNGEKPDSMPETDSNGNGFGEQQPDFQQQGNVEPPNSEGQPPTDGNGLPRQN